MIMEIKMRKTLDDETILPVEIVDVIQTSTPFVNN